MTGRIEPVPGVSGMGSAAGRTAAAGAEEEEARGGGRAVGLTIPEFQGVTHAILSDFRALSYGSLDDERCRCCCRILAGGLIVGAGRGTGTGRAMAPAPGGGGGGLGG